MSITEAPSEFDQGFAGGVKQAIEAFEWAAIVVKQDAAEEKSGFRRGAQHALDVVLNQMRALERTTKAIT